MSKGLYPIRTISAMTGVNPVTLRAWERRHGLIRPQRTPKGHRLYTEADLHRIQQILVLLERGIPISQARQVLDTQQTATDTSSARMGGTGEPQHWNRHRSNWRRALESFDEHALEDASSDSLSLFPVDAVIEHLIRPLLDELGAEAGTDSETGAQRHFLKAFLRNRLGARFLHNSARGNGPRLLAACPSGESDDIHLLLVANAAQTGGYRVLLLGVDVSRDALRAAARRSHAAGILIASNSRRPPRGLLATLRELQTPIFLLEEAAKWPETDDDPFVSITAIDEPLRLIGRRLPPAGGGEYRQGRGNGVA